MEREAFLDHLASRLGRPRMTTTPDRDVQGVPTGYRDKPFGEIGVPPAQWPDRFKSELEALGGHAVLVSSPAEASDALYAAIRRHIGTGGILTWDRGEFAGWDIDWLWNEAMATPFCAPAGAETAEVGPLRERARDVDIGVTTTDFAIANTGTLLIFTSPACARSVSLLPRHHIALVRQSQIVARLGDALPAFAAWPNGRPPSSLHFITGPSRSADIENDLTIGVHGPATVTVIIRRDGVVA